MPGYETVQKIWLTPFTKRNVEAAMQKAQRPTDSSLHGRISLAISKEGQPNELAVQDLDTWTNADFDTLWDKLTSPAPQINIDSKDLHNYLKSNEGSKEKHNQYG
jgi:hypothetical protein